jgi:hypothetical protein
MSNFNYNIMAQEDKDLLLNDLCMRLPYGVKVQLPYRSYQTPLKILSINPNGSAWVTGDKGYPFEIDWSNCKPYLFPLSSMTNELWDKEFMGCGITEFTRDSFKYGCETLEFNNDNPHLSSMVRFINQLIKNHFDIYGLIPMGLAIDATELNIY